MTRTTAAEPAPLEVSVVVPTRGRMDQLDRCLDALTRQKLAPDRYEIIVVDDDPDPHTLHLVAGWRARNAGRGPAIVYIGNPGPHGPAAARNRGWTAAHAPIIAFTDDDTVPTTSWLKHGLAAFDEHFDALCGRVETPRGADGQRHAGARDTAEFSTTNFFCRKSVLETLGGFDERFRAASREDSDLHFRLLNMRANIGRAPHAVVVHPLRPAPWGASLLELEKIAFDALLYKKHPRLYRQKIGSLLRADYYAMAAALALALLGLAAGSTPLVVGAGAVWLLLTAKLCRERLRGTARGVSHVLEMVVTSALIPPLAVFWRMAGAIRYRSRLA